MGKKIPQFDINKSADSFIRWVGSFASLAVHTILFLFCFVAGLLWGYWDTILLVLTTIVSLEAIYLAIFIQMSINKTSESLASVGEDIGEIAEDVGGIAEDVEEIQTDVDELQGNVEEIQVDVSDIQKDIDDIQGEVNEMSEDVGDIAKGDKKGEKRDLAQKELLKNIHRNMNKVKGDLERLRASKKKAAGVAATAKKKSAGKNKKRR